MVNPNEAKALVSEAFYELRASTAPDKPIQRAEGVPVTPEEIAHLEQLVIDLIDMNSQLFESY